LEVRAEEAAEDAKEEIALTALAKGYSVKDVAEITNLDIDTVNQLGSRLN
jgi:DNA-binding NarL/FixJ family response regulator